MSVVRAVASVALFILNGPLAAGEVAQSVPPAPDQARLFVQAVDPAAVASPALEAQIIDSYDFATNVLQIPLVQAGTAFFRDVRVTVGEFHSMGQASGTSGVFDYYDAASNRLFVPVVRAGGAAYFNIELSPAQLLEVGGQVTSYSVPTDLSRVSYPGSYTTPTANLSQVNRDPCRLALDHVTYPATWLGDRPLPPVSGAPLPSGIGRGVMLKDVGLQPGNPAFILPGAPGAPQGCTGDLRAELDRTLRRLKALGADFVNVPQWHWATNRADGTWTITPADETFGSLTDADLTHLVKVAHEIGLKVMMSNQIQGFYDRNNRNQVFVPPATMANFRLWFGAYQAYIAERAPFFQSLGIDIWELGCGPCMYFDTGDGSKEALALFHDEYLKAHTTMKSVFKGSVLMVSSPVLWQDGTGEATELMRRIDIVQVGGWIPPETANLAKGLSVASFKAAVLGQNWRNTMAYLDRYGKTLMLSFNIQSRGNAFSQSGYMEETSCTPGFGSFENGPSLCIERATVPDFSLQAIVFEATFEAIAEVSRTVTSPLMVNVLDYWETDSLMPFLAFPSIATSFRNKPAEGIVKAWFAR